MGFLYYPTTFSLCKEKIILAVGDYRTGLDLALE